VSRQTTRATDPGHDELQDVVYTWVDGAWPGYPELLAQHARIGHDLNPNRYRDNLDVMKYSVRSLVRHAPWVKRLVFVTTRPQVPLWLDTDRDDVRIVHHDEFFDPSHLPTFNSFAIVSNLYKLPGVSRRFLYLEDDRLFMRDVDPSDFVAEDGRLKVWVKLQATDSASGRHDDRKSPWEGALATSNHLLDQRYGHCRRGSIKHTPVCFDRELFAEFVSQWPEEIRRTSASRFRDRSNVAPEHMFPYWLLHEGQGVRVPLWQAYRDVSYLGCENFTPIDFFGLWNLRLRRPKWYSLNDNFGDRPNPRAVRMIQRFLDRTYPEPSRFERR